MDSPKQVEPDLLRCKYEYIPHPNPARLEWRHVWSIVGSAGGLHVWIVVGGTRPYGGVESHYRTPPEYMKDDEPSQQHCWLLDGPCWHDGSSLAAEEFWIPLWQENPHDHDGMFAALRNLYEREFTKEWMK